MAACAACRPCAPKKSIAATSFRRLRRRPTSAAATYSPSHSARASRANRSEEHTSELQSLMRISYAVFCLKKKKKNILYDENSKSNNLTVTYKLAQMSVPDTDTKI